MSDPRGSEAGSTARGTLALEPLGAGAETEETFFRQGLEQDQLAREQVKQLAATPRWPGLGWAIALVATAALVSLWLLIR
jgi:hypothetical protein